MNEEGKLDKKHDFKEENKSTKQWVDNTFVNQGQLKGTQQKEGGIRDSGAEFSEGQGIVEAGKGENSKDTMQVEHNHN